jgi:hypothetical protein
MHRRLPTIQEEVYQPGARATPVANLRANLDKNWCGRDARGYIDQHSHEREEQELRRRLDYDREYGPPGGVHRIMEREEQSAMTSRTGGVPSTRKTVATLRVRSVTQRDNLDMRSWLRCRTML